MIKNKDEEFEEFDDELNDDESNDEIEIDEDDDMDIVIEIDEDDDDILDSKKTKKCTVIKMNYLCLLCIFSCVLFALIVWSIRVTCAGNKFVETFEASNKNETNIDDILFFDESKQIFGNCTISKDCCPSQISTHDGCVCP